MLARREIALLIALPVRRTSRVRHVAPKDRYENLVASIEQVTRQWSRSPAWDIDARQAVGYESHDNVELLGIVAHPNWLESERIDLTIDIRPHSNDDHDTPRYCQRVGGERSVLTATVWLSHAELMAIAPEFVSRRFVEVDL